MRSRLTKLTLILLILVGAFLLVNSRAENEGPKVGIAIKTVDESGNPVEGVTYEVNYLGETIEVGPSGTDGYARSRSDAIQLFNTPGTVWQEPNITETTFGYNDLKVTVKSYPEEYIKVRPKSDGINVDNLILENGFNFYGSTWGGDISNRPTKETESGTFLDANDVFEEGEYFEYVHMLGKVEGSGMPMESIHLSFVAKKFEDPVNPDDPDSEQPVTPYGGLKIKKYKEGTTEPLAGVTYEVYLGEEQYYDSVTLENGQIKYGWEAITTLITDENGEATTGFILPEKMDNGNIAEYCLYETQAPNEYAIDNNNYRRTTYQVSPGKTTDVIKYNKEKYGGIRIIKKDGMTGELLKGAVFEISNKSNETITLKDGTQVAPNEVVTSITTDENGIAETGKILPPGRYYAKESQYPDGYSGYYENKVYDYFNVPVGEYVEKEFENYKNVGIISIRKLFSDLSYKNEDDFEFEVIVSIEDQNGNPINETYPYEIRKMLLMEDLISNKGSLNLFEYIDNNQDKLEELYNSGLKKQGNVTFVNGKASFKIKGYDEIIIRNVPGGYKYSISEKENDEYFLNDVIWRLYDGKYPRKVIGGMSNVEEFYNADLLFNSKFPRTNIFINATKKQEGNAKTRKTFAFEIKDKNGKVIGSANNNEKGNIAFDDIIVKANENIKKEINYLNASDELKQKDEIWVWPGGPVNCELPGTAYNFYYTPEETDIIYFKDYSYKETYENWFYEMAIEKLDKEYNYESGIYKIWPIFQFSRMCPSVNDWYSSDPDWDIWEKTKTNIFEGTIEYTIVETLPEGVTKENPTKDGVTYDTHEEVIKFNVYGIPGEELQIIDIETDEDGIVFTNIVNEKESKITFDVEVPKPKKKDNKKEAKKLNNPFTGNGLVFNYFILLLATLSMLITYTLKVKESRL